MTTDDRITLFFDIDNTLYPASATVSKAMGEKIHAYFVSLGLDDDEASALHLKYYTQYGLALRGLMEHHDVDPIEFDLKCDGALPLEDMISPSDELRQLFLDIDRSKARVWALTNAYKPHAERVLRILNVTDQIEGLIYCDYQEKSIICKPEPEYYTRAFKLANITDPSTCYFVDDNRKNVDAARAMGFGSAVFFQEVGVEIVEGGQVKHISDERAEGAEPNGVVVIKDLEELRKVWPNVFKKN